MLSSIAEYAATATIADLSPDLRSRLEVHLLDGLVALAAGCRLRDARETAAVLLRDGGSPLDAAAALAAAMRSTEVDDIDRRSGVTAGAFALPAALGLLPLAGEDAAGRFCDAVAVGYETGIRLAEAAGGAPLLGRGIWPSYLCAPLGAAATAARLLGLDSAVMADALALALARTARRIGRPEGERSPRWLLFGEAVRAGCQAAIAAAEHFKGDPSLLDRAWLAEAGGGSAGADDSVLVQGLGESHVIGRVSIKAHCAAKQVLAAIHGMERLIAGGLDPAAIEAVTVAVPPAYAAMIGRAPSRSGRLTSIVSAAYQLAVAALRPEVLDDIAREPVPWSDEIEALAGRVRVVADPALADSYPNRWLARIEIAAAGRKLSETVLDAPGDPALPFDGEAVKAKYRRMIPMKEPNVSRFWTSISAAAQGDAAALADIRERSLRALAP